MVVADMEEDKVADIVANMEEDKVANMVADMGWVGVGGCADNGAG